MKLAENKNLKPCKSCGKEVAKSARKCPHCGQRLKPGPLMWTAAIIILLIGFSMIMKDAIDLSGPSASSSGPIITNNKYSMIETDMSYSQVVAIIGAEGEELSRNRMEGVPGVMEAVDTVMYQWMNSNGSNMNAMFQNDKLVQKAQFGLK